MGKLFSIFVLTGFVLISAFANFGKSYAVASFETEKWAFEQALSIDDSMIGHEHVGSDDDRCPCESDSDSKKFTCGVTLAPILQSDVQLPCNPKNTRFVFSNTNGLKNFLDTLKRPPRSVV
ncbi:MAG: hypothetical protein AAGF25_01150 [Pseudomonadota bacterium]